MSLFTGSGIGDSAGLELKVKAGNSTSSVSDMMDLMVEFPMHLKSERMEDILVSDLKPSMKVELTEKSASQTRNEEENPDSPGSNIISEGQPLKRSRDSSVLSTGLAKGGDEGMPSPEAVHTANGRTLKKSRRKPEMKLVNGLSRPGSPALHHAGSDASSRSCVVNAEDNSLVEGPSMSMQTSNLHPYEDFHSFLVREGGIERERLSRFVSSQEYPRPDEDFVAYLARSIGIKDEQYIDSLRLALKCEPVMDFTKPHLPVKMEVDQTQLEVGDDEDVVSFFVRTGSWESESLLNEELASVVLNDEEDAESFLRRTDNARTAPAELSRWKMDEYGQLLTG